MNMSQLNSDPLWTLGSIETIQDLWLNWPMNNKGFESNLSLEQTPKFKETEEKPLIKENTSSKRHKTVNINVLKARAQEIQNKENRKNIFIFVFFLTALGTLGIYLSV